MQVRIIGAGWAGLAAAVAACQRGWQVSVFEAAHQAGGRAKRIRSDDDTHPFDNGQHILIGAYRATLALMRTVGVDSDQALLRTPLDLRDAQGQGLKLPALPSPLNLIVGLLAMRGGSGADKWRLLQAAGAWQRQGFVCPSDWCVQQLCDHHRLPTWVQRTLIEPLCLSALNTDMAQASAAVFLRVLQDALLSGAGGSDLLLPRRDLSELLPDAAVRWLTQRGVQMHFGHAVQAEDMANMPRDEQNHIVLATSFRSAARLTEHIAPTWSQQASALQTRSIATVYLRIDDAGFRGLDRAMLALPSDDGRSNPPMPAQFLFCRQRLMGQPRVVAAVVSDCRESRDDIGHLVAQQIRHQLGWQQVQVLQTLLDRQATFACTANLQRPPLFILPSLWACGDFVSGPYPATLEGAVRSGEQVIAQIGQMHKTQ